ncbi:hypothetical protein C8A03DRAFT_35463 [Achaetomium macrosporum]|uniref:Uncharacterized protein n=1 Tax=Achaetomium macrosporum TaxID=79813 RepID=A0AAN7C7W2_9PEZI|nr:hypothetical protein C8A03DRAFT_35463 [Achaetomium macrosporum]
MHHSAPLVALAALVAPLVASPNGWSSTKSAPDGPTKLDDCGCWPIYQAMLRCQKLKGPNSGIEDCVCIPNPDGWYTSMNGCRACLSPGSYDDDDFFDNLSRAITQLFVSCTEVGGGINSDGESICASNYYFEACAALKTDGQPSWASYEVFKEGKKGNGTFVLDIAEYQGNATATSSSTTDTPKTTTTTTSGTTTSSATTEGSASTTGAAVTGAPGTSTSSSSSTATTSPSSAMGYAGSRSQAGRILGLVVTVGIAIVLF